MPSTPSSENIANKNHMSLVVFVLWLAFCALAFWWFQFRHISNYSHYFANFEGSSIAVTLPENLKGRIRVTHILDSSCPCTKFSREHIQTLEARFGANVEFGYWQQLPAEVANKINVPATPAVIIWDSTGEIAYFGPYSSGAFCGEGDDFVEATLALLQKQQNPRWINHDALGCFCPFNQRFPNSSVRA